MRTGTQVIALLQIGPVRLRSPSHEDVERVIQLTWRADGGISAKKVQDTLWQVHSMSAAHHASSVRLLEIFSRQLAEWYERYASRASLGEPIAILRAREWIQMHYHEPIFLADVAEVARMSRWQFSGRFHLFAGTTFQMFLARTRIDHAMHLLANTQNLIAEVGSAVGFQSISQFDRTFR